MVRSQPRRVCMCSLVSQYGPRRMRNGRNPICCASREHRFEFLTGRFPAARYRLVRTEDLSLDRVIVEPAAILVRHSFAASLVARCNGQRTRTVNAIDRFWLELSHAKNRLSCAARMSGGLSGFSVAPYRSDNLPMPAPTLLAAKRSTSLDYARASNIRPFGQGALFGRRTNDCLDYRLPSGPISCRRPEPWGPDSSQTGKGTQTAALLRCLRDPSGVCWRGSRGRLFHFRNHLTGLSAFLRY